MMAYLVNMDTFCIHDESTSHARNYKGNKYRRVNTISEAKSIASENGGELKPCKHCNFNEAAKEECTK